jgi:hypothetical protein
VSESALLEAGLFATVANEFEYRAKGLRIGGRYQAHSVGRGAFAADIVRNIVNNDLACTKISIYQIIYL